MAADVVISDKQQTRGGMTNFAEVQSGVIDFHRSSHMHQNTVPSGGNQLFLDGHTDWRHFRDMRIRTQVSAPGPFYWF